jgi:H+/Cl- antiporter ClcA
VTAENLGDGSDERGVEGPGTPGVVDILRSTGLAAVLAFAGAVATVVFLRVLHSVHDGLWDVLPAALGVEPFGAIWLLVMGVSGGLLMGFGRRRLGEWPKDLQEDLAEFRERKAFDHRHLAQAATLSIISLGFGAALGPEAALTALVGGLASWVAAAIRTRAVDGEAQAYLGVTGALGALFGTAGAAAVGLVGTRAMGDEHRYRRMLLVIPGVVAALVGMWVFRAASSGQGYFDYTFPDETVGVSDILPALGAVVLGVVVGTLYLAFERLTARITTPLAERKVLASTLGGLVLAGLAIGSPLVLFSGHEGIQQILDGEVATAGGLLVIAGAKLLATTTLLATGWKGGRFFPIMFAGAAAGIALSMLVDDVSLMVGLTVVMTAGLTMVLGQAVVAGGLMLFVVPAPLWPFVVGAALLAAGANRVLLARLPVLVDPDAQAKAAGPSTGG